MERNFDELVAAALATGTYEFYQGDGFSIPWQVALPFSVPLGFTLWVYKAYLDTRWPEGARLHDWCYTPYGTSINVTQSEADAALQEYISRESAIDGNIVGAAVRFFGGIYFGHSQEGYSGPQGSVVIPNISLANLDRGKDGKAVTIKATMLINGITSRGTSWPGLGIAGTPHAFGVSESFLLSANTFGLNVTDRIKLIAAARANLLPTECTIIAARAVQIETGLMRMIPLGYEGSGGTLNVPNDALLLSTRCTNTVSQRIFWAHCIPDEMVLRGEFCPTAPFATSVGYYLSLLNPYGVWSAVTRTSLVRILTVGSNGLVTLSAANPFAVGQQIRISRVFETGTGRFRGGKYFVNLLGPLPNQLTLLNWQWAAGTNGRAWVESREYVSMGGGDGIYVVRAGTKRVGRPFDLFRGRKAAKKRPA